MAACGIWDAEAQFESDIFYFAQFSNVGSNPATPISGLEERLLARFMP